MVRTARIGILPGVGDIEWAGNYAGAHFLAKQALQQVVIDGESVLREDGIAQLLEFIEDLVVEAGVVMIRAPEHHDTNTIFPLELIQYLARATPNARFVFLERGESRLDSAIVFFQRESENGLQGLQHLVSKQFSIGEVQHGVDVLHIVLGEDIVFLGECGLHRFRSSSHRGTCIRSYDLYQR